MACGCKSNSNPSKKEDVVVNNSTINMAINEELSNIKNSVKKGEKLDKEFFKLPSFLNKK